MSHGTWGVHVRSLDRGDVLFALNAGKLMMPASNMKILTLAAAAERLGWDYRFTTTLETAAPVIDGVLHGDLIVRGTGDPTISTREDRHAAVFDDWADALRLAGISSIDGRIVGDDQAFDDDGVGPGWSWDYLEAGYAAPIGALQYNESTADLRLTPGAAVGDPVRVVLAPGAGLTVVNHARTMAAATGERGSITVRRRIDRQVLEISGSLPADAPPVTRTVAVVNPTQFFAQSLKDALIARGIAVTGDAVDLDDISYVDAEAHAERRVLATTTSPSLREIATVLMKVSQNQYAETLLKTLGAAAGGLGTTAAGRRAAAEVFAAWGMADVGYVMSDGSGLSRYNYVSPATITTVLARMYEDPRHRDRLHRDAADRRHGRDHLDAHAADARRGQRRREDRVDLERARAVGVRPHARRRDARVLDPRQRLRDSVGHRELDRGRRGGNTRELRPVRPAPAMDTV